MKAHIDRTMRTHPIRNASYSGTAAVGPVTSELFEIANVLVRLNHVANCIVNADYKLLLFTLSSPRSPCPEKP